MPIPAATGDGLYGPTIMTSINNGSERPAAAIINILNGFFMELRHNGLHKAPNIGVHILVRFFEGRL